jgi:cyanuric acid amidohydrolase
VSAEDTSELVKLLEAGEIKADEIVAIMNMTEGLGNGRSLSNLAFSVALSPWLGIPIDQVPKKIPLIMIGGCSGLVAPYIGVFVRQKSDKVPDGKKHFSIGVAQTRDLKPEEIGTMTHVELTEQAVKEAMEQAGITEIADVHCVQTKNPGLTPAKIADADRRGAQLPSRNIDTAGAYSRGCSALGVALALGEVPREKVTMDAICRDFSLYSNIASTSMGGERTNCAVIVMGNSTSSVSDTFIGHSVLKDGADILSVLEALRNAGMELSGLPTEEQQAKIDHVFVKSNVDGTSVCRGRRHVLNTDFLGYAWLVGKSVIHATVTAVVGDPMMQVSGGGEHQAPLGGGLVAVVVKQ